MCALDRSVATPSDFQLLCFYINATSRIQVIRITNIPNFHWEKVILPGQKLLFETVADAQLEIHTSQNGANVIADVIPCQQLRVTEEKLKFTK
ncbi:protein of unknown function (DUF1830) [Pleurocapsa sp. PCC 7327]|nr:protein of unknown function (DUF1830) [Pleurocapsa sp. PCC 7327]